MGRLARGSSVKEQRRRQGWGPVAWVGFISTLPCASHDRRQWIAFKFHVHLLCCDAVRLLGPQRVLRRWRITNTLLVTMFASIVQCVLATQPIELTAHVDTVGLIIMLCDSRLDESRPTPLADGEM